MKKEIGKYIAIFLGIVCIILITVLIYIKSTNVSSDTASKNLKSKTLEEIRYLDSNIIEVMNRVNNITVINYKVYTREVNEKTNSGTNKPSSSQLKQSSNMEQQKGKSSSGSSSDSKSDDSDENSSNNAGEETSNTRSKTTTVSDLVPNVTLNNNTNDINWDEISFTIENIFGTWPTINLDMQENGISNDDINNFSASLNGVIQSVKNRDKNNTLINLYNMYTIIPRILSNVTDDNNIINMYNTKLCILNSYVLATTGDNWNEIISNIQGAKGYFNNIVEQSSQNTNTRRAYIIIDNLENIAQLNDKDIFFMGYKNVIQQLETL